MSTLLPTLALCLAFGLTTDEKTKPKAPAVPPAHADKGEAAHGAKDEKKPAAKDEKKTSHGAKEEKAEKAEEHEAPKPAPKPVVRKKPVVAHAPAVTPYRASEAELRAGKLLEENAQLQQEIARRQGYTLKPVATPDEARAELLAGNERFVAGYRTRTLLSRQDIDLRDTLSRGQSPFAVIVTCSDSRLADNLLFDQELGRLFTIREAGNCPDIQGLASIEYAVEHLGSKFVVVLGHTACGAVKAVKESHGVPLPGNLWSLQAAMAGLLETCHEDPNEHPNAYLTRLAETNARRQAQSITDRSTIVSHLVSTGKVKVAAALYDLVSGRVKFLEMKAPTKAEGGHH